MDLSIKIYITQQPFNENKSNKPVLTYMLDIKKRNFGLVISVCIHWCLVSVLRVTVIAVVVMVAVSFGGKMVVGDNQVARVIEGVNWK